MMALFSVYRVENEKGKKQISVGIHDNLSSSIRTSLYGIPQYTKHIKYNAHSDITMISDILWIVMQSKENKTKFSRTNVFHYAYLLRLGLGKLLFA